MVTKTQFLYACVNGNKHIVKKYINSGQSVNIQNDNKYTALMYASGNEKIVKIFFDSINYLCLKFISFFLVTDSLFLPSHPHIKPQ